MNDIRRNLLRDIGIGKLENEITSNEWENISKSKKLSEEFIREFKEQVNWVRISRYQNLSEDFIREFQDSLFWNIISGTQTLSEEFIREFRYKVDWISISESQKISELFIREFKDSVFWNDILIHQIVSEDFLYEFKNKINWNWYFTFNESNFLIMKRFILKSNHKNIDRVKADHLTIIQKDEIAKLLSLKYMFTKQKTS